MDYLTQTLAALAAAAVLAACGGGDTGAFAAVLPAPSGIEDDALRQVPVESCVTDAKRRPHNPRCGVSNPHGWGSA